MNKHTFQRTITSVLLIGGIILTALTGCENSTIRSKSADPIQRTDFLLNTFVDIKLYDSDDTTILDDAIALCKDYEAKFSRTIETSEVYALNHRATEMQEIILSEETADLLELALHYCEISDGGFDITIEPISSLWDFTSDDPVLPDSELLKTELEKVGYESLQLQDQTLLFHDPDTRIDLGAIAKGYIADRIKDLLIERGVESAIINLGGNVLCIGTKPNGTPFQIGLKKPFAETSETFAIVGIDDLSVVTSGVYERCFEYDGVNYHHILDPSTGYPYANGLVSVTILSPSSADGDGLSTACFSLGLEKGMELINSLDGIYACFIDEDYNIYYSDGMESFISESSQ